MGFLKFLNRIMNTKIKDPIVLCVISGLLGGIAMDVSNTLLWKKNKSEVLYGHLGGSVIMRAFRTNSGKNFMVGQIFHWVTSSIVAMPLFHYIKRYGKNNYLFKGSAYGLFVWAILYNGGQRIGLYTAKPHLTKSHFAAIWHNALYGIIATWSMVRFAHPSLFAEESHTETSIIPNSKITNFENQMVTETEPLTLH